MYIFPVRIFSLHHLQTRFANLKEDLCLSGLKSATPTHRAPFSTACNIAQRKMQRAGWNTRLYSARTRLFPIQNSPKWLEKSFYVHLENPCSPKLPAFKVRRRLKCIQPASEQSNRPLSCYVVLFLQSKFQMLSENPRSPNLPAFKVGRRLGCIQSASEQNIILIHVML